MIFDITRLKGLRKQLDLTQHQFAKQAGVSQSLIAKLEAGRLDPSYSIVKKLEEAVMRLSAKEEPDAKSLMAKRIISVQPKTPAKEVIEILRKNAISQLPVIEAGSVIGLVSESSVLEKEDIKHLAARDVMTLPPPIVQETTKRSVLISLLRQYPFILIAKGSSLVGVVTKADILKVLV